MATSRIEVKAPTWDAEIALRERLGVVVLLREVPARRGASRCAAVDARRGHLTMTWVVSFVISRPFGRDSSATAQIRTRDHPLHQKMDTSRIE